MVGHSSNHFNLQDLSGKAATNLVFTGWIWFAVIGKTKYEGELEVEKLNPAAIILRVPILYGETEYNGESAVNALIDSVKNVRPVNALCLSLWYSCQNMRCSWY